MLHHSLDGGQSAPRRLAVRTVLTTQCRQCCTSRSSGFIPAPLLEDYATIHGHDERISVENVRLGCQVLFDLVRRLAAG
jgi:acetylornithine deacetylase/succinyl-diaminopimelate desuccinylase-like protein